MSKPLIWIAIVIAVSMAAMGAWIFFPSPPLPENTPADFEEVTFHSCHDGDTCNFTLAGIHPLLGRKIGVRLAGIDTPEMRGKCASESRRARQAKAFINRVLRNARHIRLLNARRGKYFRIVAEIEADGVILNSLMIQQGFARPYDGGKRKGWCG